MEYTSIILQCSLDNTIWIAFWRFMNIYLCFRCYPIHELRFWDLKIWNFVFQLEKNQIYEFSFWWHCHDVCVTNSAQIQIPINRIISRSEIVYSGRWGAFLPWVWMNPSWRLDHSRHHLYGFSINKYSSHNNKYM